MVTEIGSISSFEGGGLARSPVSKNCTIVIGGKLPGWRALERSLTKVPDFVLLRCAGSAAEILSYCQRLVPCVLLVDLSFLEAIDPVDFGNLVDFGRSIQVLAVGEEGDPETVEALVRLGCMGFVKARATSGHIQRAVRTVAAREFWFNRATLSRLLQTLLRADRCKLTSREGEILRLIGQGLKNQEIADHLFISPQTVRWHIRSLYSKIGVRDRLSAAMYAVGHQQEEPRIAGSGAFGPALP